MISIILVGIIVALPVSVLIQYAAYKVPADMLNQWESEAKEYFHNQDNPPSLQQNLTDSKTSTPQINYKSFFSIKTAESITGQSGLFITILVIVSFILLAIRFEQLYIAMIPAMIFTVLIFIAALIDIKHFLLPDNIVQPLLWLGLIINSFAIFATLADALWGCIFGFVSLWGLAKLFRLITSKEPVGWGDFKFQAAIGAWVGWDNVIIVMFIATTVSIITVLFEYLKNKKVPKILPFGPYWALAGWSCIIIGPANIAQLMTKLAH